MRCIRTEEYPEVWREWIAMLTLKAGGTASDIAQYRDLWLVPHGQKLVMHMLSNEYDEVNAKVIPGSQAGWESERMCAESDDSDGTINDRAGGDRRTRNMHRLPGSVNMLHEHRKGDTISARGHT